MNEKGMRRLNLKDRKHVSINMCHQVVKPVELWCVQQEFRLRVNLKDMKLELEEVLGSDLKWEVADVEFKH